MKSIILSTLLFSFITPLFAQYMAEEEIDDKLVKQWTATSLKEYQYVYKFGFSEGEYELVIIVTPEKQYAFTRSGEFTDDGRAWIQVYEPLTNVRIENDRFYSDQYNGQFAIYEEEGREPIRGLKLLNTETNDLHKDYEFGYQSYSIEKFFSGKYPEASYTKLNETELQKMSKAELQIMRNEIFARYGYIFREGGKMQKHFKSTEWYRSQHKNVDLFLTELEKENIALIRKIEQQ